MKINKVEKDEPIITLEIDLTSSEIKALKDLDVKVERIPLHNGTFWLGSNPPCRHHGEIIADTLTQCILMAEFAHEIEKL